MFRATLFTLALATLAAALTFAPIGSSDASTAVGPPWISLELPVNPMEPATRDAVLLVRTFHHEHPAGVPVRGTAEGRVNGERRTIELELRKTAQPGVYAIEQNWPAEGDWLLTLSAGNRPDMSLVVELGPDGGVRQERFYGLTAQTATLRSVRIVPGPVEASR